jgi:hypothetical protein
MLRLANRQLTATSQSAHITGRPERQNQPEHRTAPHVTRKADVPVQEPGVPARWPGPDRCPRRPRGVGLAGALQDARQMLRRDARASVGHLDVAMGRRRRRSAPGQHPLDPARIGRQPERLATGGYPVRQAPRDDQRRHQGPDIPPRPEPLRRQTNQYRAPTSSIRRASNEYLTAVPAQAAVAVCDSCDLCPRLASPGNLPLLPQFG